MSNRRGPDKTLLVIEKLKRERENRRKSAEEYKRRRADEIKENERKGRPGDVDFQRLIRQYRQALSKPLSHASIGPLKINVVVRKRPVNGLEVRRKDYDSVTCNNPMVYVHYCKYKVDGITKFLDTTKFMVDHCFGEDSTNNEVYEHTTKPLLDFALNGGRATCFAYGQTGSGKTYTMAGVQSIAAKDIFSLLNSRQHGSKNLAVYVAFFELYGGRCIDLLHGKNICMVREDGKGRVQIEGLQEVIVTHMDELLEIIQQGNGDRTTHATEMNNVSSRSHAICQIAFRKKNSFEKEPYGKLSLIDLAGSERGQDTKHHNKQRRVESAEINKSLLALKECIRALDTSNNGNFPRHVPYRASKLTMVLKDSFSNDARTVMISCVSPAASSSDHTLNTLRYADRVKEKKAKGRNRLKSKSKLRARRRQTINFSSTMGGKGFSSTLSGRSNHYDNFGYDSSKLSASSNSSLSNGKTNLNSVSRTSDPIKKTTAKEVDADESFDLGTEIEHAIEKYDMTTISRPNENVMKYGNTSPGTLSCEKQSEPLEVNVFKSAETKAKRHSKKTRTQKTRNISEWGPVDTLENLGNAQSPVESRASNKSKMSKEMSITDDLDEEDGSFANMSFKELITQLVEEEDKLLKSHMNSIERNTMLLREESRLLEMVKADDAVDYDIDEYSKKLEQILIERSKLDKFLLRKLRLYMKHLDLKGVTT